MERKHNPALTENAKALRRAMTKEERRLWFDFLRSYPVRFRRQKILGKDIADFYSANAGIVIELDGSQHYEEENLRYDQARTAYLTEFGIKVLRIPNNEVNQNFTGVCEYIDWEVSSRVQGSTL